MSDPKPFKCMGISIGDNDFTSNTLMPFLKALIEHRFPAVTDVETIKLLWRHSAFNIYFLCQARIPMLFEDVQVVKDYLEKSRFKVLFDEELEREEFGNGEWACVALTHDKPYFYTM